MSVPGRRWGVTGTLMLLCASAACADAVTMPLQGAPRPADPLFVEILSQRVPDVTMAAAAPGTAPGVVRIRCGGSPIVPGHPPLLVIDGVKMVAATLEEPGIDPDDIASITIMKGTAAVETYGEAARYGALLIQLIHREQPAS
jgi:hypothetical protein